jgi:hypothetical protein
MKKTAVEWLEWQLGAYIKGNIDELTLDDYYFLIGIAKEMEKEHIIESYKAAVWDLGCKSAFAEQYYNETFNQQEQ